MADARRYRSCNAVRKIDCPHVFFDKRAATRGPFGHTSACNPGGRNLFDRRRNRAAYEGPYCFGVEGLITRSAWQVRGHYSMSSGQIGMSASLALRRISLVTRALLLSRDKRPLQFLAVTAAFDPK